jgi:DNA helicase-2/ATP-dependent DNA helicase PcrA
MALLTHPAQLSEALGIPFSAQQLAAITAPLEPSVIIAGAGSGKTTVMAARVVWLVGTGQVRPEQVLGLTFTRKAAAELSGRVRAALAGARVVDATGDDDAGEQVIMTYDAFASRLVADHGLRIGVEGDARMLTGASRFRMASKVVSRAPGPWAELGPAASRLGDRQGAHARRGTLLPSGRPGTAPRPRLHRDRRGGVLSAEPHQGPLRLDEAGRGAAAERAELSGLVEDYQRLKRDLGAVEFADQMGVAADLARRVPDVSRALRVPVRGSSCSTNTKTPPARRQRCSPRCSRGRPEDGRGFPVTAVGDPCQAIYGWRGAAAANIITFATHFPRSDGHRPPGMPSR